MRDDYEQDIPVSRVKSHPAFGIGAKNLSTGKIALYAENDIALLELSKPARIDARTSPVCVDSGLPEFSEGKESLGEPRTDVDALQIVPSDLMITGYSNNNRQKRS